MIDGNAEISYDRPQSVIYVSGVYGNKFSLAEMHQAYELYGDNVHTEPSVISLHSKEQSYLEKQKALAERFKIDLESGEKATWLLHSSGAAEALAALETLRDRDGNLPSAENLKKINIVLLGPSGIADSPKALIRFFKGLAENGYTQPNNADALLSDQAATILERLFKTDRKILDQTRNLETLMFLPPQFMIEDDSRKLLETVAGETDKSKHEHYVLGTSDRKYEQYLSEEDAEKLIVIDDFLEGALVNNDETQLKDIMKVRFDLLQPYIKKAYNGEYAQQDEPDQEFSYFERHRDIWMGRLNVATAMLGIPQLLSTNLGGKTIKRMRKLVSEGAQVGMVANEKDSIFPLEEAKRVMRAIGVPETEVNDRIILHGGISHDSWALHADSMKDCLIMLDKLLERFRQSLECHRQSQIKTPPQ